MKQWIACLLIVALMAGCVPAPLTPTSTPLVEATSTLLPYSIPTHKPSTPTIEPTFSPAPTASITPASISTIAPDTKILSPANALDMKRIHRFGTGKAYDIKWSPNGKYLALATAVGVFLYDSQTFEEVRLIDVNEAIESMTFSPDGLMLAIAVQGKVSIWSIESGAKMSALEGGMAHIIKVTYGHDGRVAAIGNNNGSGCCATTAKLIVWNVESGSQIFSDEADLGFPSGSFAVAFSPDGKKLAYGGISGLVLYEFATKQTVSPHMDGAHDGEPRDLIFNKDGDRLFAILTDQPKDTTTFLQVFDLTKNTASERPELKDCTDFANGITLAGCYYSSHYITAEEKDIAYTIDLATGEALKQITVKGPSALAISPDGRLAAYIHNNLVNVVEIDSGRLLASKTMTDINNPAVGMGIVDEVQRYLFAADSSDGKINLLDLATGEVLRSLPSDGNPISGLSFSPDRNTLAAIEDNNILQLWNLESGKITHRFNLEQPFTAPIQFSPNGLHLAMMGYGDGSIDEFDLQTQKIEERDHGGNYYYINHGQHLYTPQSHLLFLDSRSALLFLVDSITKQEIQIPFHIQYDEHFVDGASISADAKYLAGSTPEGDIYIWEIATQKQITLIKGVHKVFHGDGGWGASVKGLVFSPKSDLLVSIGYDDTIKLWNIHTGNQIRQLNVCCYANFTPDGRYLVTVGNGVIRVWGVQ